MYACLHLCLFACLYLYIDTERSEREKEALPDMWVLIPTFNELSLSAHTFPYRVQLPKYKRYQVPKTSYNDVCGLVPSFERLQVTAQFTTS